MASFYRFIGIFVAAFLGLSYVLIAGESLTLEQAFEQVESNPAMVKARATLQESQWHQLDALSPNLPRGNFYATHTLTEKYQVLDVNFAGTPASIAQVYPKTTYGFGLQWTVFDGLQTPAAFSASRLLTDAAKLDIDRLRSQLHSEVRVRFFQAVAAQELADVQKQNVKALEDHLEKANSRRRAGEITRFDSLRIQVQLEEARPELTAAEDNIILNRQLLLESLGQSSALTESAAVVLQGKLPVPDQSKMVAALNAESLKRADVEASQARLHAAEKTRMGSWGKWAPKLSLNADKVFYNNIDRSFSDDTKFRDAYSVGVSLVWELFDAGTLAKNRIAAAQAEAASATTHGLQLHTVYEFDLWKRRYLYATELYQARSRALEAATESLRLANAGWTAGSRTSSDILDAELDLFRARAGMIHAQLDAVEAISHLELAIGRDLL